MKNFGSELKNGLKKIIVPREFPISSFVSWVYPFQNSKKTKEQWQWKKSIHPCNKQPVLHALNLQRSTKIHKFFFTLKKKIIRLSLSLPPLPPHQSNYSPLFARSTCRGEDWEPLGVGLGAAGNQNLVRGHTFKQKHTSRWVREALLSQSIRKWASLPSKETGRERDAWMDAFCVCARETSTQTRSSACAIFTLFVRGRRLAGGKEGEANQSHSKK